MEEKVKQAIGKELMERDLTGNQLCRMAGVPLKSFSSWMRGDQRTITDFSEITKSVKIGSFGNNFLKSFAESNLCRIFTIEHEGINPHKTNRQ